MFQKNFHHFMVTWMVYTIHLPSGHIWRRSCLPYYMYHFHIIYYYHIIYYCQFTYYYHIIYYYHYYILLPYYTLPSDILKDRLMKPRWGLLTPFLITWLKVIVTITVVTYSTFLEINSNKSKPICLLYMEHICIVDPSTKKKNLSVQRNCNRS